MLMLNFPRRFPVLPLEITLCELNGVHILALSGRLILGQESTGFRSTVDKLLSSGATKLVINLEHANYIDSAGLGALIEAHRNTKAKGGHLKLAHLGPNFRKALETARLLAIFDISPTEAAALESSWS
jgi:anti-sigma B factor antagonist